MPPDTLLPAQCAIDSASRPAPGSVRFFGPLTVAPEHWNRGIAQHLLDATMDLFTVWGTRHAGLFTFAQSAKHVGLYQKFGAVRPGPDAGRRFGQLIDACHGLAAEHGASVLVAGTNAGRERAWRELAGRGVRARLQGVTMHHPNEAGYSTTDAFVIDDWR